MTMHVHDHVAPEPERAKAQTAPSLLAGRPRWLLPAVAGVLVVGALVALGIVELSTVLYVGALGGMLLMHLGGHGHGHGASGGSGHAGHGGTGQGADAGADEASPQSSTRSHGCH